MTLVLDAKPWLPDGYCTLFDAIEKAGEALFKDWTGEERKCHRLDISPSFRRTWRSKLECEFEFSVKIAIKTQIENRPDDYSHILNLEETTQETNERECVENSLMTLGLLGENSLFFPGKDAPSLDDWLVVFADANISSMKDKVLHRIARRDDVEAICRQALFAKRGEMPRCKSYHTRGDGLLIDFPAHLWWTQTGADAIQSGAPGVFITIDGGQHFPICYENELAEAVLEMQNSQPVEKEKPALNDAVKKATKWLDDLIAESPDKKTMYGKDAKKQMKSEYGLGTGQAKGVWDISVGNNKAWQKPGPTAKQ
ncbi:MAG: hypothetical protein JKY83_00500 [Rhizobiaceae bacterium]|nr:hypothetical protein [Rhizobiaceae bacterium]